MIRAILFDCNGVIADDEPVHMRLFQQVLKEEGITLTKEEYFCKYLAMDDRSCFTQALKSAGKKFSVDLVPQLIDRKAQYYQKAIEQDLRIFPGISQFVQNHARDYALAVVSGALRNEIKQILSYAKIQKHFAAIISAEDVSFGKPDPEGYRKGVKILAQLPIFKDQPLQAKECVAIEDSIHGVDAAHGAGVRCIAITNSYPAQQLKHADLVVSTIENLDLRTVKF